MLVHDKHDNDDMSTACFTTTCWTEHVIFLLCSTHTGLGLHDNTTFNLTTQTFEVTQVHHNFSTKNVSPPASF